MESVKVDFKRKSYASITRMCINKLSEETCKNMNRLVLVWFKNSIPFFSQILFEKNPLMNKSANENFPNCYRSTIGRAVRGVLAQAKIERRLICGLYQAIVYLQENVDDALLCLLPETRPGDVTAHMQTVLLQAYCYENCIPVITVDSGKRLAELCGISSNTKDGATCACAVITRDQNIPWDENGDPPLSPGEKTLSDFYECTIEEFPRPVIALPVWTSASWTSQFHWGNLYWFYITFA